MKTIYLDMDGVVADFNAYADRVLRKKTTSDRWPDAEWTRLKDNVRLYRDLEKTPEADQLVEYCRTMAETKGYHLVFLTAVPRNNDVHWAFYDKVLWAQFRYPDVPVFFGPYSHDKHIHCLPGDILIDDRTSNITEWRAAGGVGILHRGNLQETLSQLVGL